MIRCGSVSYNGIQVVDNHSKDSHKSSSSRMSSSVSNSGVICFMRVPRLVIAGAIGEKESGVVNWLCVWNCSGSFSKHLMDPYPNAGSVLTKLGNL